MTLLSLLDSPLVTKTTAQVGMTAGTSGQVEKVPGSGMHLCVSWP